MRKVTLNQPVVTMGDCPSMMGSFIDGAVLGEMMREDMLPHYAHSHLSERAWLDLALAVPPHHPLECTAKHIRCDSLAILNPQVAVRETEGERKESMLSVLYMSHNKVCNKKEAN